MTTHCSECGSEMCNHGNCPECSPCMHCDGGDRSNKRFGYDDDEETERQKHLVEGDRDRD